MQRINNDNHYIPESAGRSGPSVRSGGPGPGAPGPHFMRKRLRIPSPNRNSKTRPANTWVIDTNFNPAGARSFGAISVTGTLPNTTLGFHAQTLEIFEDSRFWLRATNFAPWTAISANFSEKDVWQVSSDGPQPPGFP